LVSLQSIAQDEEVSLLSQVPFPHVAPGVSVDDAGLTWEQPERLAQNINRVKITAAVGGTFFGVIFTSRAYFSTRLNRVGSYFVNLTFIRYLSRFIANFPSINYGFSLPA
jgi:hypothetical protein